MQRLMLALSSQAPNRTALIETAARLAGQLQADWFVVHVRERPTLHYRAPVAESPVPTAELAYAKSLGATVLVERGDLVKTLVGFARKMSIEFLITGRSQRSGLGLRLRLPLAERVQRKLPQTTLMII